MKFAMLKKITRKIRHKITDIRQNKSGWIFHKHAEDIVLTKKELLIQLFSFCCHENLIKLFIFGKDMPDYELVLQKISLKFEVLSSFVYMKKNRTAKKLQPEEYIENLFQPYYESFDEVKEHICRIANDTVCDDAVWEIYKKMQFFINCSSLLLADEEPRWEHTYRCLTEYTLSHSFADESRYPDIWEAFKAFKNKKTFIRQGYRISYLPYLPKELKNKICGKSAPADFRK